MNITEKAAYIKGLMEGMELDADKKETKVLTQLLDLVTDMANDLSDVQEDISQIYDEVDAIDEDLDDIESFMFDEDEDDDEDDDDEELYEITCPNCGEVVCVDEDMLADDNLCCPNCDTKFEIDFSSCDCEDCDDCDCHKD